MKIRILMSLLVATAVIGAMAARGMMADEPKVDENVKCPVSGKPAKATSAVDFEECKVFLCCNNCPKAFQNNPEKFAAKAHHQMVQTGQMKQKACPFSGKPTKAGTEVDVEGVSVAFCCENCKGKVESKTGAERVDVVFKSLSKGFEKASK